MKVKPIYWSVENNKVILTIGDSKYLFKGAKPPSREEMKKKRDRKV